MAIYNHGKTAEQQTKQYPFQARCSCTHPLLEPQLAMGRINAGSGVRSEMFHGLLLLTLICEALLVPSGGGEYGVCTDTSHHCWGQHVGAHNLPNLHYVMKTVLHRVLLRERTSIERSIDRVYLMRAHLCTM